MYKPVRTKNCVQGETALVNINRQSQVTRMQQTDRKSIVYKPAVYRLNECVDAGSNAGKKETKVRES